MLIPFPQLFAKYNINPTGVLHVGAHWGEEADEYDRYCTGPKVWVEALPDAYAKLVQHVQWRKDHLALKACISDADGDWINFKVASNQGQSSSILDFGTHSKEHPDVRFVRSVPMQTTRLDTLLKQYRVTPSNGWFLNIDLQGAELMALRGMGKLLQFFTDAYIEVNQAELYKGCPLVQEIDAFLAQSGFVPKEEKFTGAKWGDKYYRRE